MFVEKLVKTLRLDAKTCCSDSQMLTLDQQLAVPQQILRNCPSCNRNFFNLWCYLSCGDHQDERMIVDKLVNNSGKEAISQVSYYVSTEFADGMFESCRNVQVPSLNATVLNVLCGTTADECTPEKWLSYMGSTSNGQAPFDIKFTISNGPGPVLPKKQSLHPLNVTSYPCNVAPSRASLPCRCQDCPAACVP